LYLHDAAQGDGKGGALYYSSSTGSGSLALISCRFLSNSGDNGGALYVDKAASVVLMDTELALNNASTTGGAVYVANVPKVAASTCRFTSNNAGSGHGGALYVRMPNSVVIATCEFFSNNAANNGGAVYVANLNNTAGWMMLAHSQFDSNNAVIGGAVYCEGLVGRISLDNSLFIANSGSQAGGAVFLDAAASTTHVSVCDFRGNRVQQTADSAAAVGGAGGALYIHLALSDAYQKALVRVAQSNFTDNDSSGLGGAMLLLAQSSDPAVVTLEVELAECRFVNSSAAGGGAVYAENVHRLMAVRTVFDSNVAVGGTALGGALLVRRVPKAESSLQRRRLLSESDGELLLGSDSDTALSGPPAPSPPPNPPGAYRVLSNGRTLEFNPALQFSRFLFCVPNH
jgi:predicted outer membrane repeat protein